MAMRHLCLPYSAWGPFLPNLIKFQRWLCFLFNIVLCCVSSSLYCVVCKCVRSVPDARWLYCHSEDLLLTYSYLWPSVHWICLFIFVNLYLCDYIFVFVLPQDLPFVYSYSISNMYYLRLSGHWMIRIDRCQCTTNKRWREVIEIDISMFKQQIRRFFSFVQLNGQRRVDYNWAGSPRSC